MEKYNLVILAGETERDKTLCELEGVSKKSFLKMGEKTFIERAVEEAIKCNEVGDIYVSGMAEEDWKTDLPITFVDDQSTVFRKVLNVYKDYITKKKNHSEIVIIHNGDIPLFNHEMLSKYIQSCKDESGGELDGTFYYAIVKREHMEAKFPNSNRSYASLKEYDICGGDITIVNVEKMKHHEQLMDDLVERRKNIAAQLFLLNPLLIFRFLFKRLTIDKFMKSVNKRVFKIDRGVYAVLCNDPEIAMDVDKTHQLAEVRRYYSENKDLYD